MIRRLYVDNFRSLVDFTWEPGAETLVLGYNGSGKTSVLEAVQILQDVCTSRGSLALSLGAEDRTIWSGSQTVRFEIDVQVPQGTYRYALSINLEGAEGVEIGSESLTLDGTVLFMREQQRVQLANRGTGPDATFPISTEKSVVAVVGNEFGGEQIVPFREWMARILYLKPEPTFIYAHRKGNVSHPDSSLYDLVPWYRHLTTQPEFEDSVLSELREIWPELTEIITPEFSPDVHDFVLKFKDGSPEGALDIPLRRLSDGERLLIGLYVVVAYQKSQPATTIIIDEPDNFVSLLEIQPWLLKMLDSCPDEGQIILVSHNEELIRTMGREHVAYFSRKDHLSPTTVRGISHTETEVAPLRDLLRRGWLDE